MLTTLLFLVSSQASSGAVLLGRSGTGTLNALNTACSVSMAAEMGVGVQLAPGTLIGIITPELSFDNGTTWVATYFDDPATGSKQSSITVNGPSAALTQTIIGAGGISNARVRVSTFTSGTATCTIRSSAASDPTLLAGGGVASSVKPPVALQLGGYDVISGLFMAPAVTSNGGTPLGSEPALIVNSVELVRIRQLLEQLVELEKSNNEQLRGLREPGRPSP